MDHLRHDDSNKKRSRRKSNKLEGVVTELEDVDLKTASVKIQNAFSQVQKRAAAVLEEFNQEDDEISTEVTCAPEGNWPDQVRRVVQNEVS